MDKQRGHFPDKQLTYNERVERLRAVLASLPERNIDADAFGKRCVSFVVGNAFDSMHDGIKLTSNTVLSALYGARGITRPGRGKDAGHK